MNTLTLLIQLATLPEYETGYAQNMIKKQPEAIQVAFLEQNSAAINAELSENLHFTFERAVANVSSLI
ncbi:MAG: hypothetical protein WAW86_07120 [Gammaproteobacteria bacterium]